MDDEVRLRPTLGGRPLPGGGITSRYLPAPPPPRGSVLTPDAASNYAPWNPDFRMPMPCGGRLIKRSNLVGRRHPLLSIWKVRRPPTRKYRPIFHFDLLSPNLTNSCLSTTSGSTRTTYFAPPGHPPNFRLGVASRRCSRMSVLRWRTVNL